MKFIFSFFVVAVCFFASSVQASSLFRNENCTESERAGVYDCILTNSSGAVVAVIGRNLIACSPRAAKKQIMPNIERILKSGAMKPSDTVSCVESL